MTQRNRGSQRRLRSSQRLPVWSFFDRQDSVSRLGVKAESAELALHNWPSAAAVKQERLQIPCTQLEMSHKKRKFAPDDEDRSLHNVFAAAAKAVTALYASAEKEHKRSRLHSRQLLERQFQWVLREYGNSDTVPTQALLQYLQQEAQNLEAQESAAPPTGQPPASGQARQATSAFGAFANRPFQDDGAHGFPQ